MNILAIDPGTTQSAWVVYDGERPVRFGLEPNEAVLSMLRGADVDRLALEMVASYGMPVGREVFETVLWSGRFLEAAGVPETLVYRKDVKLHLCHSMRAKDANIRQALIDRFGGNKRAAVGVKAAPGPLYGFRKDLWAALGVAVTWWDTKRESDDG